MASGAAWQGGANDERFSGLPNGAHAPQQLQDHDGSPIADVRLHT